VGWVGVGGGVGPGGARGPPPPPPPPPRTMDGWMDSNESPFLGVPALRGLAWLVTKLASEAR
jgi:hypothetical protein